MESEAKYHFYYALIAFSLGVVSRGLCYFLKEPFSLFKNKPLEFAGEIFVCVFAALLFIAGKNLYNFPALRAYHIVCFLLGFLLISKICDKRIAFFNDRLYNKLKLSYIKVCEKSKKRAEERREKKRIKQIKRLENKRKNDKRKKNLSENRKIKKGSGFGNRGGGVAFGNFNFGNGLSTYIDKSKRKRDKQNKSRNRAARRARQRT